MGLIDLTFELIIYIVLCYTNNIYINFYNNEYTVIK